MTASRAIGARIPVLVAAAAVEQREADPERSREPVRLMIDALERAADEAGCRDLLARADRVAVPRGFWAYPDPARLIAAAVGAASARSELADIGVLQTTLVGEAARAIAAGEADVVLIAGGEARDRERAFARAGRSAPETEQPAGTRPDRVSAPEGEILHPLEIERGIPMPVQQYAMIENALRAREGLSLAAHRQAVAELWAGMSRVAAANPHAWSPRTVSAAEITAPSAQNQMLAFPYGRLLTSQWNVDQAAGLVLCSADAARGAGVREDRWLFPLAVADSNHMVPLVERADPAASPGFRLAARAALDAAGLDLADIALLELYSCFPAAVRVQMRELGVPAGRAVSETGGMTFAGGPLNNFVLQAIVRIAERLREGAGETALVTAVSGMITKQGVSVWGRRPGARGFRFDDVTAAAARATRRVPLDPAWTGPAQVVTYTVLCTDGEPVRAVYLCDTPAGGRALAVVDDAAAARALLDDDPIGRTIRC